MTRIAFAVGLATALSLGAALPVQATDYASFNKARYKAASRASTVLLNPQPLPPKVAMPNVNRVMKRASNRR